MSENKELSPFQTIGSLVSKLVEDMNQRRVFEEFYREEVNEFGFVHEMEGL
ncbi:hypothetical protein [Acetobacter pasteurianus]|uniref:hypothetical protein n=1 Tax=Acetobacter pasteurianus TaxID=438 RepID=UPI003D09F1A9